MRIVRFLSRIAALLLCAAMPAAASAEAPLREESTFLRLKLDNRDVRLEALIVRPEAATERLPLALITHGKPPSSVRASDMRAAGYANVARDLARRGWLAAVVMRRGFGQSDGPNPVPVSCSNLDYPGHLNANADELEQALKTLQQRGDVDPSRAIALGPSAGGAAVMALAARKPAGLRGVINVSGGLSIEGCVDQGRDSLVNVVKSWQSPDAPPQLWIYAKNDTLFPPELVDRMRSAARDAGGNIRFIGLPEMPPDGHMIFRANRARFAWLPEMDASLRAWNLPTWSPALARQYFVRLGLSERAGVFDRYFSAPGEKALAFSASRKHFRYHFGTETLDRAKEGALSDCAKAASDCIIAFENDTFMLPADAPR